MSFFDGNDLGGYDLPEVEIEVAKHVPVGREPRDLTRDLTRDLKDPA